MGINVNMDDNEDGDGTAGLLPRWFKIFLGYDDPQNAVYYHIHQK